jgi:hypothetical protein
MVEFIEKNPLFTHSHSLVITYPRTVLITHGNYPYMDHIHNLLIQIKNNISEKNSYASNVKGGKTNWNHFVDNELTTKFINYCINKHVQTNPQLFQYFYERKTIRNAWGNELKKGDYVKQHIHFGYHCILYLTEGAPLLLPELNIKLFPKPGDYYFFPPYILHGVEESKSEENRYCLVMNIDCCHDDSFWNKEKTIYNLQKNKDKK